jgi:hypothetical protein
MIGEQQVFQYDNNSTIPIRNAKRFTRGSAAIRSPDAGSARGSLKVGLNDICGEIEK